MRGWVSSANEYKRVFIIGFQPILEVWAPALPSEQLDTTVDQLSRTVDEGRRRAGRGRRLTGRVVREYPPMPERVRSTLVISALG
jgi:hypothetical protein